MVIHRGNPRCNSNGDSPINSVGVCYLRFKVLWSFFVEPAAMWSCSISGLAFCSVIAMFRIALVFTAFKVLCRSFSCCY